jgi:flagellar capping protein FliD
MPVSQDFKANMATLFVQRRMADASIRGHAPVDNIGTHIKQPLARPKTYSAQGQQQQMLAHAAVTSLKQKQSNIQTACDSLKKKSSRHLPTSTTMTTTSYPTSKIDEPRLIKPSDVRKKQMGRKEVSCS